MAGLCCQIRTGVLFLGFLLGFSEVTLWVIYYTWREDFRKAVGWDPEAPQWDLLIYLILVCVDVLVNIMLISGANKDYSGRRKDLRKVFISLFSIFHIFLNDVSSEVAVLFGVCRRRYNLISTYIELYYDTVLKLRSESFIG